MGVKVYIQVPTSFLPTLNEKKIELTPEPVWKF